MEGDFKIICPACKQVGQIGCPECGEYYTFSTVIVDNELICNVCNSQKLLYYEQSQADQQKHQNCVNYVQRSYYYCENCESKLCPCVLENQNIEED